jgi:hypothetical protein
MQFDNQANTEIHRNTTAQEILNDFPEGLDYLIAGVGTGGHITACAQILKKSFPQIKVLAVEPELSAVLSGGAPGPHPIQGIGAGFIPSILDTSILDGIVKIGKEEAFTFTRRAASEEGLFIGISSGAALAAVQQKSDEFKTGARILTFNYDTGRDISPLKDYFEFRKTLPCRTFDCRLGYINEEVNIHTADDADCLLGLQPEVFGTFLPGGSGWVRNLAFRQNCYLRNGKTFRGYFARGYHPESLLRQCNNLIFHFMELYYISESNA